MSVLMLIFVLAIFFVIVWAITTFVPMPPKAVQLIYAIAIIAALFVALNELGVVDVPRLRLGILGH